VFRKVHSILNFGRPKITHSAQMVRVQWRLGIVVTIAVGVLWYLNALYFAERVTLDHRTQWFWKHAPEPSRDVVVVAVDDPAEDTVGRWPWPRSDLATVVRELKRAGTKVIALDLLLNEAQNRTVRTLDADPFAPGGERMQNVAEPSELNDDDDLAAAIAEHGGVVIAGNFKFALRDDEVAEDAISQMADPKAAAKAALKLTESNVIKVPVREIFEAIEKIRSEVDPVTGEAVDPSFTILSPDAADRLAKAVLEPKRPQWRSLTEQSPEKLKFRNAFNAARTLVIRGADSSIDASKATIPGQPPRPFPRSMSPSVPIPQLAAAAARVANVTFDSYDDDAIVRKVPMWVEHNGRLWPTLGLAAVMQYEGLKIQAAEIIGETTILTRANGDRQRIEMLTAQQAQGVFAGLHYITWPRGIYRRPEYGEGVRGWAWQFYLPPGALNMRPAALNSRSEADAAATSTEPATAIRPVPVAGTGPATDPNRRRDVSPACPSEISAGRLYEPKRMTSNIRNNIFDLAKGFSATYVRSQLCTAENLVRYKAATRALLALEVDQPEWQPNWRSLCEVVDECAAGAREELAIDLASDPDKAFDEGAAARADGSAATLRRLLEAPIPEAIAKEPDPVKREEALVRIANHRAALGEIPLIRSEVEKGVREIAEIRRELFDRLHGRIVFFGFVATGSIADFVGTSIDPRTPGVHAHAAVANAILNNHFKTQWFWLYDYVCIGVLGMLGTFMAIRASVIAAPVFVVLLMAGWSALSAVYLWDQFNIVNSVSGPSFAALGGVGVVLLHRLLVEQKDRRRVEERFKAYVSPDVVDELVNNPELASMVPFARDMTVMFTDVADFTTTSERLGPVRLAAFLDRYLGEMTRILQANRGTRDKYLGDGIMCFWNAPRLDPDHAYHACVTAVKMLQKLDQLNAEGAFSDAGLVKVRIGIAAGSLMVGDFGNPPVNSSYTVLGDTANLSSRLESANKFFGSRILANQRVKDLATPPVGQPPLRWRRIGKVNVKGKKDAESLWELIGELSPHGPATDEWIEQTEKAVMAYQSGEFESAGVAFDGVAKRFGDETLGEIYADSITLWKGRPDRETAFDGAIVLTEK